MQRRDHQPDAEVDAGWTRPADTIREPPVPVKRPDWGRAAAHGGAHGRTTGVAGAATSIVEPAESTAPFRIAATSSYFWASWEVDPR